MEKGKRIQMKRKNLLIAIENLATGGLCRVVNRVDWNVLVIPVPLSISIICSGEMLGFHCPYFTVNQIIFWKKSNSLKYTTKQI
jgi:hypothetical protein